MNPLAEFLLNTCAETVLAVDAATLTIVSANKQAENLLGYPVDGLIGRPIADFEVGLQDIFFWEEVRNGSRPGSHSFEGEYRHRCGHQITVQKTIQLLEMQGKPVFVLSVHDISAIKQLEDETARTASLLAATLESTIDGILVTSLPGKIHHFNHRFAELWRLPLTLAEKENEANIFKQLLQRLDEPHHFRAWFENLITRPQIEGSTECRLLDGRIFSVSSRPQRLRERPVGRVFSFHDITSLKTTEIQLIAARDAAQAANRAKTEFLSHISHELRTPLNAMLGFGKILETELDGPARKIAEQIGKTGKHLLDLISEMVDLANIDAGKIHLKPESVDLADLVTDCLAMLAPLAEPRHIALHATPLEAGRFLVCADARRLKQMAINLLSNAIKYNRENGRVDVTVTARDDNYWRLTVIDTGMGIEENTLPSLFEPSDQSGSPSAGAGDASIGLALTRKLACLMNGDLGVESQPGIGSRFWIDLPCAQADSSRLFQAEAKNQTANSKNPDQSATLLYIDSDPLSQKLLAALLSSKRPNYRLLTARTSSEGMQQARTTRPDVILLDQHLPDGKGFSTFQMLRKQPETRHIPVIAMTENAPPEEIRMTLDAGYAAHLNKPLQIDATLAEIDKLVQENS